MDQAPLRRRTDVVVGGWLPSSGRANEVGALLLCAFDTSGVLQFIGSVGTGFTGGERRRLGSVFADIASDAAPFGDTSADTDNARWVSPILVGSVEYREFTGRRLRHPSWKGQRADLTAREVVLDALA